MGLRVSEEEEKMGLDISQHGERAYTLQGLSVLQVAELTVPAARRAYDAAKGLVRTALPAPSMTLAEGRPSRGSEDDRARLGGGGRPESDSPLRSALPLGSPRNDKFTDS